MKQTNMFGAEPNYPLAPGFKEKGGASQEAAEKTAKYLRPLQKRVLGFFIDRYPRDYSADQVGREENLSPFCTRPRCTELHKQGLLEKTDRRVTNESGYRASTWRASRQAMEANHGR